MRETNDLPPFTDQPPRAFWYKPDGTNLNHTWKSLNRGGDSPCPTRGDMKCPVSLGRSNGVRDKVDVETTIRRTVQAALKIQIKVE
jgi:hypothetical protein